MKLKKFYQLTGILPLMLGLILMAYAPNVSDDKQDKKEENKEKVIAADKLTHDFGTIKESDGEVSAVFTLTNNTDAPIAFSNVTVSCGCSNSTWTKEPIAPGKTGEVTITFNPAGLYGPFDKNATVFTNGTPNRITLKIKGIVE